MVSLNKSMNDERDQEGLHILCLYVIYLLFELLSLVI
jgi:hypothetical protein